MAEAAAETSRAADATETAAEATAKSADATARAAEATESLLASETLPLLVAVPRGQPLAGPRQVWAPHGEREVTSRGEVVYELVSRPEDPPVYVRPGDDEYVKAFVNSPEERRSMERAINDLVS